MTASTTHPARPLFDSNFVPGMLTNIVVKEFESRPDIAAEPEALKQGFAEIGCPNVGRLIDMIERENRRGMRMTQIGSGSIDLQGVTQGKFSREDALMLQELYIGDRRRKILPLPWLAYLLRGIAAVPAGLLPAFDMVAGAIADFQEAVANARLIEPGELDRGIPH